jgi:hypothetical protein
MISSNHDSPSPTRTALAVIIVRIVIPLWLGVGAVLKLVDGSPSNLPTALVKWLGGNGTDLRFVLEFSIASELVVAGVMVLLPGLARLAGIAMLTAFLPVLIGDLAMGASSCGCFGAVSVPPWVTLLTDLLFLGSLLFLAHRVDSLRTTRTQPTWRVVLVGIWSVLSVAVAFGLTANGSASVGAAADVEEAVSVGPEAGYYLPAYDQWVGRPFAELEIAQWIQGLPEDIGVGPQYVLFYRLDCEHCHELMEVYFSGELPLPTTAVAVPERSGFPEAALPFVCGSCRLAELPSGFDWFLQTPVLVRLSDGIVECAAEVEAVNPTCLDVY